MKTLIVYYSNTGKTEQVADAIAKELKADKFRLERIKEIKGMGFWSMFLNGGQALLRSKPKLKDYGNMDGYDRIIVGSPVWSWDVSSPVRSFLSKNSLEEKKVAIYACCGGQAGKTIETMKNLIMGNVYAEEIFDESESKDHTEKARRWAKNL